MHWLSGGAGLVCAETGARIYVSREEFHGEPPRWQLLYRAPNGETFLLGRCSCRDLVEDVLDMLAEELKALDLGELAFVADARRKFEETEEVAK